MNEEDLTTKIGTYITALDEKIRDVKSMDSLDFDENCPPKLRAFRIAYNLFHAAFTTRPWKTKPTFSSSLENVVIVRENVDALCTRDMAAVPGGVGLHHKNDPKYIAETIEGHRDETAFFEKYFPNIPNTKEYPDGKMME